MSTLMDDNELVIFKCFTCEYTSDNRQEVSAHVSATHVGKEVSLAGIKVTEEANKDTEFVVMYGSTEPKPVGKDSEQEAENRQCVLCPKILDTRPRMREHVLNHYKQQLLLSLPRKHPFTCPVCNSHKRDKITLLRHYAFTHKYIHEFSNDQELLGKLVSEADTPEVSLDGEETHSRHPTASLPINTSIPLSPTMALNVSPRSNATIPRDSMAPSGVYMCSKCDYITAKEVELKEHTEVMHQPEQSSDPDIQVLSGEDSIDKRNYQCTICLVYAAESLSDLKEHGEKFHHTSLKNVTRTWDKETHNLKYNDGDQNIHKESSNYEGEDVPTIEIENTTRYMCSSCTFTENHADKFHKHIRDMHHFLSKNPYEKFPKNIKCLYCSNVSKKLRCLRAHVQLEHQNHPCALCDFVTLYFQDLKNHTKRHHKTSLKVETYWLDRKTLKDRAKIARHCVCEDCHNQKSKDGRLRTRHGKSENIRGIKGILGQLGHATDELEKEGLNKVQKSEEKHPKRVKCPHCDHVNWSKAYKYSIIAHMKNKHLETPNLKCPFCDEVPSKFPLLQNHLRKAHKWIWDVKKYGNQKRQNRVPIMINITSTHHQIGKRNKRQTESTKIIDLKSTKRSKSTRRKRGRPTMPKKTSTSKKQKSVQETMLEDVERQRESNMLCVNYLEIVPSHKHETLEDPRMAIEEVDPLSI